MKWQVWIGWQLRSWRATAHHGTRMHQDAAAGRSGLNRDHLSRIESGERRLEVVELRALATTYGKNSAAIAALFTPPSTEQWTAVLQSREPDTRFTAPPQVQSLPQR